MSKKKQHTKNLVLFVSFLTIILSPILLFFVYFLDKAYPNIYVSETNLGGKTKKEVADILTPKVSPPKSITLNYKDQKYDIPVNSLDIKFDENKTVNRIFNIGRSGNIAFDLYQTLSLFKSKKYLPIEISINRTNLENQIATISGNINIPAQDAKFAFVDGRVKSFQEALKGLSVNEKSLEDLITSAIEKNDNQNISLDIPILAVDPKIQTSDVNNLGITELIGSGSSRFAGSIGSRIYNINLAASRINNALIAPNQIFSFDNQVGDISKETGYEQAYIIQNGQTILGDGGGVCQVSTTLFRAAMNSGLTISERHAHAYRVHYYEEDALPGFDATVYYPNVDLKFINNTPNYILIQTQIDLKNLTLTFNIYGTKDGRSVNITSPKIWGYTPAPAPLYTDDPTLPIGQVKQVDFAAPGTKSQFEYTVTKDGQILNHQTFYSDFKPWQAKFLRGTKA